MKKFILTLLLILGFESSAFATGAVPLSFADIVDKLSPAVVNISTTQVLTPNDSEIAVPAFPPGSGFEGFNEYLGKQYKQRLKPKKATSLGSGFIIDPNGIIVTNNHVIGSGEDINVTLYDNTQLKAKVIGRDTKVDVAILKIEAGKKLPFVVFGDSDDVRVGDWILAIGNPYGLGGSVSAGIISARARDINVGPFDDFLQTDAAINRGNSGGPMFDLSGRVIGINTAIFSPTGSNVGIGFAMPAALVEPVIKQLVQYGKSRRAWLGIKIQSVTKEIADSIGFKEPKGALVLEVNEKGPADAAGLKTGDVITAIGGQQVTNMRRLPRIVAEKQIGEKISLEFLRSGKTMTTTATLGELDGNEDSEELEKEAKPQQKKPMAKTDVKNLIGIEMAEMTAELAKRYSLSTDKGLLVTSVSPDSGAAEQGIAEGMIIVKANNQPVTKISDLEAIVSSARKAGRGSVLLLVMGGEETRFIAVPLK